MYQPNGSPVRVSFFSFSLVKGVCLSALHLLVSNNQQPSVSPPYQCAICVFPCPVVQASWGLFSRRALPPRASIWNPERFHCMITIFQIAFPSYSCHPSSAVVSVGSKRPVPFAGIPICHIKKLSSSHFTCQQHDAWIRYFLLLFHLCCM